MSGGFTVGGRTAWKVRRKGDAFARRLAGIDGVAEVRGRGLMLAAVLTAPVAKSVEEAARRAGYLVGATTADVVRLAPPLIITEDQLASFTAALPSILDAVTSAE